MTIGERAVEVASLLEEIRRAVAAGDVPMVLNLADVLVWVYGRDEE